MLIGSLFSGIGGLELGLEMAGLGRTAWQVEQDEFCRSILAKNWPNAQRFDDVRAVGAAVLPAVDIICGGFPCQDISVAGAGAGLAGARSGLWFEYLRIVEECRPRAVVVENVAALQRRGLDVVAGGLRDLGYEVVATRIRASDVGAPHQRERLLILAVAYASQLGPEGTGGWRQGGGERASECGGQAVAHADGRGQLEPRGGEPDERGRAGDSGGRCLGNAHRPGLEVRLGGSGDELAPAVGAGGWVTEPGVGRATHGLPAWVDRAPRWPAGRYEAQHPWEEPRIAPRVRKRPARLKALGNAVVPQVAMEAGRVLGWLLEMWDQP